MGIWYKKKGRQYKDGIHEALSMNSEYADTPDPITQPYIVA